MIFFDIMVFVFFLLYFVLFWLIEQQMRELNLNIKNLKKTTSYITKYESHSAGRATNQNQQSATPSKQTQEQSNASNIEQNVSTH